MRNGTTRSCGCLYKEAVGKSTRLELGMISYRYLEHIYKTGAKKRGYSYELTMNELKLITCQKCYYCGSSPRPFNKFFRTDKSRVASFYTISDEWADKQWILVNGIDRVENSIGYVIDNVVSCCKTCNDMKGTLSLSEFKSQIKNIFNNHCL